MKTYNQNPYYDDFAQENNFYQILFKPGYAVQARELTQLQTILRDQIAKFGDHIFKHGSVVIPGNSLADLAVSFVKVGPISSALTSVTLADLEGLVIEGQTNHLTALVKKAVNISGVNYLYISYLKGNNGSVVTFQPSEAITSTTGTPITATVLSSGVGSMAFVNAGVYYINGSFVHVPSQSVVISSESSTPSCHVLLKITESIVDSVDDSTLLDPAQGSYNYAAPGADRVKIDLALTTLPLDSAITSDYVELMRYNEGTLEEHSRYPKYSELEKSLARRTYDESGNYVVEGLEPVIREHLKLNNNNGVYTNGDSSKLVIDVSPGKAYIEGFEVEKIARTLIPIDKARTSAHVKTTSIIQRPSYGQFIYISNLIGMLGIATHQNITLWNDNDSSNSSATQVGTAKVLGIDYFAGDPALNPIYKLWISDINFTGAYTAESVGGLRFSGATSGSAYVLTEYNVPLTTGTFTVGKTITHSSGRTATVKYWNASESLLYAYKHDHTKDTPRAGELVTEETSGLTATSTSKKLIISAGETGLLFALPKTAPKSLQNSSNQYEISYTAQKQIVFNIGETSKTIAETIQGIEVGTFCAFSTVLPQDATSTVVSTSHFSLSNNQKTLTITNGPANTAVYVYCTVTKTSSPKTKTKTTGATDTFAISTTADQSALTLSKVDIISVSKIESTSTGVTTDITNSYTLWNGQTDYRYEHGKLYLKPNATAPVIGASVTVTYDYYSHSTGDFFCIDSYNNNSINTVQLPTKYLDLINLYKSPTTGKTWNLLNSIDFRPTVGNDNTLSGTNAKTNDLIVSDTTFNSALQYFVPRIDILAIDAAGSLKMIQGIPSETPVSPTVQKSQFPINVFYIPEYTRSVQAVTLTRLDVERYRMQDIKRIVKRVERLEDFATLTAAETSISNYDIVDAATGLTRYKTGYLVENFNNPLAMARTTDASFSASFVGNTLQAGQEKLICDLSVTSTELAGNYITKDNYLMLPYTEEVFAKQPLSSRVTNLNPFAVISWNGILKVTPPSDSWVDMVDMPTIFETKYEYVDVPVPAPPPPIGDLDPVPFNTPQPVQETWVWDAITSSYILVGSPLWQSRVDYVTEYNNSMTSGMTGVDQVSNNDVPVVDLLSTSSMTTQNLENISRQQINSTPSSSIEVDSLISATDTVLTSQNDNVTQIVNYGDSNLTQAAVSWSDNRTVFGTKFAQQ